ncbi:DHA2 family efflux MFS transporter permease subunit [Nocardia goodfellowii]|uniref:EmrB/QacA subfamily drug resistance transporter n=1 Tax=Nocardia goodfellowii TaxID=882446 RepID=A0ABS4QCA5_9NOCA|nr:DHA2 family efflux MFS transporter permease subunit [Nocardia goodfellowii]MBP2189318.1 EmrB/QacA subfamily drug resistance transporter [Nocardia goodfellowii]
MPTQRNPWLALGALVVGFFMILLDMTIVAVANPAIMRGLHADVSQVIWVTSAYLLTYAVPLLVTGRLGDRFGPKNIYLIGLVVFTAASLGCGLSGTITQLIVWRAVQGLGAAMMTPQTMAVITRTFAPDKRGAAMGLWGGVAGLATLVGPILGGVLIDSLGWEWIFIVNVPVGIIAFGLVVWLVPVLPTRAHKYDLPGIALSGVGLFLLVFGLQEGNTYDWSPRIWLLIVGGLVFLALFVLNQARNKDEPLMPLELFRDRNFALSSLAIATMGAAVTALMVPAYFYLQAVRDLSPTESALVFAPMAIVTGILSPFVGKFSDNVAPRIVPTVGFAAFSVAVFWWAVLMAPDSSLGWFLVAAALAGIANACIWGPLASTATHNLPVHQAGAGAGIYNTTRQVGSVLGSAAISALIAARMSANGLGGGAPAGEGAAGQSAVPAQIRDEFSAALSEAMLLPAGILLVGVLAAALFVSHSRGAKKPVDESAKAEPVAR